MPVKLLLTMNSLFEAASCGRFLGSMERWLRANYSLRLPRALAH